MGYRRRLHALMAGIFDPEWWGFTFARPLAALLLSVTADVAWLTPNLYTHASFALQLWGSWVILRHEPGSAVLAVVLLQASLVFDCCDGQLARYRKAGSKLGSYYDKVSDFWGFAATFFAVG